MNEETREKIVEAIRTYFLTKDDYTAWDSCLKEGDLGMDGYFSPVDLADAIMVVLQPRDVRAELRAEYRDILE